MGCQYFKFTIRSDTSLRRLHFCAPLASARAALDDWPDLIDQRAQANFIRSLCRPALSSLRLSQPGRAQRPGRGPGLWRAISFSSKEQERQVFTWLPDAKV